MRKLVAAAGIGMTAVASIALVLPAGSAGAATTGATASPAYQTISASPDSGGGGGSTCSPTPVYPMSTAKITLGPETQTAVAGRYHFNGTYTCNGKSLRGHHLSLTLTQAGAPPQVMAGRVCGFTKYSGGNFKCSIRATGSGSVTVSSQSVTSNPVLVMQ